MMSRSAPVRSSERPRATCANALRNTRCDWVAPGVVGIQQAFRRRPPDQVGGLASQIYRILHAGVEALSTMPPCGACVCSVAGQESPENRQNDLRGAGERCPA